MTDLYGFKYSVYAWIAGFCLHEKGVSYQWHEVNPFADDVPSSYLDLHPFCRVPTLVDGDFVLYETGAITRYVDDSFDGPPLMPVDAKNRARANQIIAVVDSYTYWSLVRQVFSHGVMGPRVGRPSDSNEVAAGLEASEKTLDALENLAGVEGFLVGPTITLADIHLAPMLSYFCEHPDGLSALEQRHKLSGWFAKIETRESFVATKPTLPAAET